MENTEIIYSYTRKQAIEDGNQILLENDLADLAKEVGWKYPVYITSGVWSIVEQAIENKKHCNDLNGVMWDILYMAKLGKDLSQDTKKFQVIITGTGRKKYHTFYIQVGATDIDNADPCLTIMLPEDY